MACSLTGVLRAVKIVYRAPYRPGSHHGVLRGGSWASAASAELYLSCRNVIDRWERDVIYGFRVALVPAPEG